MCQHYTLHLCIQKGLGVDYNHAKAQHLQTCCLAIIMPLVVTRKGCSRNLQSSLSRTLGWNMWHTVHLALPNMQVGALGYMKHVESTPNAFQTCLTQDPARKAHVHPTPGHLHRHNLVHTACMHHVNGVPESQGISEHGYTDAASQEHVLAAGGLDVAELPRSRPVSARRRNTFIGITWSTLHACTM